MPSPHLRDSVKNATTNAALIMLLTLAACTKAPATPAAPIATTSSGSSTPEKLPYPEVLVRALNGDHDAEFELGAMFHDGDGIGKDFVQALEWYKKSADAGNRQAQFNLALMYKNGEGIERDLTIAKRLFTRAADAGDVRAMFHLGQMSYLGQGGSQDYKKALEFYVKSGKGGFADAQMNAGVMYVRGEGIAEPDLAEAYAWLKLAKNAGNERARNLFDTLSAKLTEDQKKRGEERVTALTAEIRKAAGPNAKL